MLFYNRQQRANQLMRIISNLRSVVKMADFFNSNQLLRLQDETEYRTFTGGLISIGIIITIILAFASMIIDTVNRSIINFTHSLQKDSVPSLSEIIASSDDGFMFAVEVLGYNLSSEYRYFDVLFQQIQSNYGDNYVYTPYNLQPCTKQHWAMLPSVVDSFEKIKASNWLCPTIGTVIKLQGKYSSQTYNQFSVTLYPCSNSTDPSRPCASRQQIDSYVASNGQWNYFTFYYVNSYINADQPQYKNYYLQDRNYIPFSSTLGAELDMYLTEIEITSDNSIWPFTDYAQDSIFYIPFGPILYPIAVDNTTCYATFFVMKDYANESYNRQVQKIFVVFSFMGGLIGAIMGGLFIMNSYTNFAYETFLAASIFKNSEQDTHKQLKQQLKGSLHFIHFIQYYIYPIIKKFKNNLNWPFIQYIKECREEIINQLNVKGLIQRIIFLQYATSYILQDYHIVEMQKGKPSIPSDIKKLREKINPQQDNESQTVVDEPSSKNLQVEPQNTIQKNDILEKPNFEVANSGMQNITNQISEIRIQRLSLDKNEDYLTTKQQQNVLKLRESARQGNPISKKLLLQIIQKPSSRSISSNVIN